jgi:hypothetical protein
VQVDSVAKFGWRDGSIPANVAEAVNFYQSNGFLHGRSSIHAVGPAKTKILGNFRFDYSARHIDCTGFPWFPRTFMRPHIEIENDPQRHPNLFARLLGVHLGQPPIRFFGSSALLATGLRFLSL